MPIATTRGTPARVLVTRCCPELESRFNIRLTSGRPRRGYEIRTCPGCRGAVLVHHSVDGCAMYAGTYRRRQDASFVGDGLVLLYQQYPASVTHWMTGLTRQDSRRSAGATMVSLITFLLQRGHDVSGDLFRA